MQAERELSADLRRMADIVVAGLELGEAPTVWQARRAQIAALRQRIRSMRDRHLGRFWASSSMTRG